jgi:hypothetical protein
MLVVTYMRCTLPCHQGSSCPARSTTPHRGVLCAGASNGQRATPISVCKSKGLGNALPITPCSMAIEVTYAGAAAGQCRKHSTSTGAAGSCQSLVMLVPVLVDGSVLTLFHSCTKRFV